MTPEQIEALAAILVAAVRPHVTELLKAAYRRGFEACREKAAKKVRCDYCSEGCPQCPGREDILALQPTEE